MPARSARKPSRKKSSRSKVIRVCNGHVCMAEVSLPLMGSQRQMLGVETSRTYVVRVTPSRGGRYELVRDLAWTYGVVDREAQPGTSYLGDHAAWFCRDLLRTALRPLVVRIGARFNVTTTVQS